MMKGFVMAGWVLPAFIVFVSIGCNRDRSVRFGADKTFERTPISSPDRSDLSGSNSVVQHRLCPVTGEPIDSMGGSIPVNANGQTIFVCCKGCVTKVENDPDKYLAIALSEGDGPSNRTASSDHSGHSH